MDILVNDVYAIMKSSKVFVLPSTREGFGIVVIEANACGIPVITTNHKDNAAKDLIKNNRNGLVCNLAETETAMSIRNSIENNTNFKNTVSIAKSYDWENITKQIEATYIL